MRVQWTSRARAREGYFHWSFITTSLSSASHHHHRIINIRRWLSWYHYHFHCWLQSNEREMMMMVVVHFRHATPPPPPQYIINKQQHKLFRECTKCRRRNWRRNARRPTQSWKHFALPTDKIIKIQIPITWTRRNTSECVVVGANFSTFQYHSSHLISTVKHQF